MRTIFVLRGLPASSKSTFAKDLLKKEPGRWKRVNRDDLRAMVDNHAFSKNNEDFIRGMQDQIVRSALSEGFDVIMDNTHLVQSTLNKVHRLAESIGDIKVIEKGFNVSVEECIKRNALREGHARVPDKVIRDMARAAGLDRNRMLSDKEIYYPPLNDFHPVVQDENLPKAIICDLDGTLALLGDRSPYDASECDVKDKPNDAVIKCILAMHTCGFKIIFMSGREAKYRDASIRFIEQYTKLNSHYQLHMRGTGDQRKDSIVKRELFDEHVANKYHVQFVLDDRNSVVNFWRSIGLSCFQVNPGDF